MLANLRLVYVFIIALSFGPIVATYAHEPHRTNCPSVIDVQVTAPAGFQRYSVQGADVLASVRRSLVSSGQLICRYNHPTVHISWRLLSAVSTCTSNGNNQYTCVDSQNLHPTVVVTCPSTIAEVATNLSGGWQASNAINASIAGSGANTRTANDIVYCHFNDGTTPSIEIHKSVPSRHICSAHANGFDCKVQ